jgi:hypothetical protein
LILEEIRCFAVQSKDGSTWICVVDQEWAMVLRKKMEATGAENLAREKKNQRATIYG